MSSTSWSRKTFGVSLDQIDTFCAAERLIKTPGKRDRRTFTGALPPLDALALRGLVRSWTVRSAMGRVGIVGFERVWELGNRSWRILVREKGDREDVEVMERKLFLQVVIADYARRRWSLNEGACMKRRYWALEWLHDMPSGPHWCTRNCSHPPFCLHPRPVQLLSYKCTQPTPD